MKLYECTIDELGRILIPSELRQQLGWSITGKVSIYHVDRSTLIFQLSDERAIQICSLCNEGEGVTSIKDSGICRDCVERICRVVKK